MRAGLERGEEPVQPEGYHSGSNVGESAFLADALPDQVGATDFGDGCQHDRPMDLRTIMV
jgi:hypothetical protein